MGDATQLPIPHVLPRVQMAPAECGTVVATQVALGEELPSEIGKLRALFGYTTSIAVR